MKSLKLNILYVTLGSVLVSSTALAKMYVNSMCYMKDSSAGKVIEGDKNKGTKFPLASISKVVTSLWAIEKLGPDYRFKTKLYVTKNGSDSVDIHIEGSRDPIMGRNSSYFIISELNRLGIKKVESLTFDENFLLDWLAEEKPRIGGDTPFYDTLEKQTEATRKALVGSFATSIRPENYNSVKAKAAKLSVTMVAKASIDVRRVEFLPRINFKNQNSVAYVYQSAPLHLILKRMNNQSNNYIADNLYWDLGGTAQFNQFVKNSLALTANDIEFVIGSGNNADYIYGKDVYNEATCETMVKLLYKMDKDLGAYNYDLSKVMAVAGVDSGSTVASWGGNFAGAMTAKTGSVNVAKTLAGSLSTKNGEIFFAVLMHTDSRSDWGAANAAIKNKVNSLIKDNGGPRKIKYQEILTLPFDKGSVFTVEAKAINKT